MRSLVQRVVLLLGVLMTAQTFGADAPVLKYLHLYTDSAGVTRIKEEQMTFNAPGAEGPLTLPLVNTEGATFLRLNAGAFEDWHVAPRRWFLIAVQGISEVTTSDGKVRRILPGTVLLMDDTSGKGHQTRAIGPDDHVALVVPVDEVPGLD